MGEPVNRHCVARALRKKGKGNIAFPSSGGGGGRGMRIREKEERGRESVCIENLELTPARNLLPS